MNHLTYFKVLILFVFAISGMDVSAAKRSRTIQSTEEFTFYTTKDFKLLSFGKISNFVGLIDRNQFTNSDMKTADLYKFNLDEIKMTDSLCKKIVDKVVGLTDSKLYELRTIEMATSNKGTFCQADVRQRPETVDPQSQLFNGPFHHYLIVGFINAEAVALVYHPKEVTESRKAEALQIWEKLR